MECRHQYRFLKLASVKSIKTAALFSFVIISNIMVKTFFSRATVLYSIEKKKKEKNKLFV